MISDMMLITCIKTLYFYATNIFYAQWFLQGLIIYRDSFANVNDVQFFIAKESNFLSENFSCFLYL